VPAEIQRPAQQVLEAISRGDGRIVQPCEVVDFFHVRSAFNRAIPCRHAPPVVEVIS
jgi:hypothetical protein